MPDCGRMQTPRVASLPVLVLAGFLVLAAGFPAEAQELAISIDPEGSSYTVRLALLHATAEDILRSLADGLRAEISFHIRVYRKSTGLFRFFGDRLVEEASPTFEARWDMFRKQYIIDYGDGRTRYFPDADEFLKEFYVCPSYTITATVQNPSLYYVLAQSNIRSMKLVPPFTILSALFPLGAVTTSWKREDLLPVKAVGE